MVLWLICENKKTLCLRGLPIDIETGIEIALLLIYLLYETRIGPICRKYTHYSKQYTQL